MQKSLLLKAVQHHENDDNRYASNHYRSLRNHSENYLKKCNSSSDNNLKWYFKHNILIFLLAILFLSVKGKCVHKKPNLDFHEPQFWD